ncbi:MAG: class I SAM-dependent methyltransferase [Planctomycetota bacterium]
MCPTPSDLRGDQAPIRRPSARGFARPLFAAALERRKALIAKKATQAFRAFSGTPDGVDGVFIDVYGPGAVLIVYEGSTPKGFDPAIEAVNALDELAPLGVRAVYFKPFAKDRSKLGGELPAVVTDKNPAAGEPLTDAVVIRELDWNLEIRLYDGLSTGLFLDQRENRGFVARWVADRIRAGGPVPSVLNTFAYTCAFSIAAAKAGAATTSVDVSPRYLDWGKRNFAHNAMQPEVDSGKHRFARMDTFEYLAYAKRKALKHDLIILDPPSFATGSRKKGIKPWSSTEDYARLVREAATVLGPKGVIFASTNTHDLCKPGRLDSEITRGLGRPPRWIKLPEPPTDFATEHDRFAARAFGV